MLHSPFSLPTFSFATPTRTARQPGCYPITGGLLARRPAGSITLTQSGRDTVELSSRISGFVPRLAARPGRPPWTGTLYEQVQSRIHVAISRRYFSRLARGNS